MTEPGYQHSPLAVLLVEPRDSLRALLSATLAVTHRSLGVSTGREAIDTLAANADIGLMITDLVLPDVNGLDLLKEVRQRWPHVPVILLTAYGIVHDAVRAMQLGATDFLAKPVDPDHLRLVVARSLAARERSSLMAYLHGPVFLSYARADADPVRTLYAKLRKDGYQPWMDTEDLVGGEQWEIAIRRAIESSAFFLACVSRQSVNRRGMVQKEMRIALEIAEGHLDTDIYLIPVRLEDCPLPKSLERFQRVDLFQDNAWSRLVDALTQGLKRRRV